MRKTTKGRYDGDKGGVHGAGTRGGEGDEDEEEEEEEDDEDEEERRRRRKKGKSTAFRARLHATLESLRSVMLYYDPFVPNSPLPRQKNAFMVRFR